LPQHTVVGYGIAQGFTYTLLLWWVWISGRDALVWQRCAKHNTHWWRWWWWWWWYIYIYI